jgi:signal recognition particle subunit SRP54
MTPEERRNPKVINGSRRLRIAKGSGVAVGEVSQLVTNFFEGQKQMKAMMGAMGGAIPGIPGMGGGRSAKQARQAKAAKNAKGKRRSGDPRKAALGSAGGQAAFEAAAAASENAPASMEELAELLKDAQANGGAGMGTGDGFPGFRGGPAGLPQLPGGTIPAAFGNRNKKKK